MGHNNNDKTLSCGHKSPDTNLDHIFGKVATNANFKEKYQIAINLQRPNKVLDLKMDDVIGKWTMVYDEGFEFKILNYAFFAFSKYKKDMETGDPTDNDTTDTSGYKNVCNETFL